MSMAVLSFCNDGAEAYTLMCEADKTHVVAQAVHQFDNSIVQVL